MTMLKTVEVSGFKSIEHAEIKFGRLNVLSVKTERGNRT